MFGEYFGEVKPTRNATIEKEVVESSRNTDIETNEANNNLEEEGDKITENPGKTALTTSSFFKRKLAEANEKASVITAVPDNNSIIDNSETNEKQNLNIEVGNEEEDTLTCPVCFSKNFKSEEALTLHVEECLSKQAISSILDVETRNGSKTQFLNKVEQGKEKSGKRKKSREGSSLQPSAKRKCKPIE